jgi:peptidoglycan/LPS O-acetylase OafA/YrhL
MSKKLRIIELDALRGLAVLAVVCYHYTFRYDELYHHTNKNYYGLDLGYLGVHLFFIISGFVIFMTIENVITVKNFIYKRIIRLYPVYIIAVIITYLAVKIFGLEGREVKTWEAVFNLTMLQGFIPLNIVSNVDGVYWSLTVEIIFYIFMGVIIWLGLIKKIDRFLIAWLFIAFIVRGLNVYYDHLLISIFQFYGILLYAHLFIAGIMFYKLKNKEQKSYYHIIILACVLYEFIYYGLLEGIILMMFFTLFYGLILNKLNFLTNKITVFLGSISYSLYLIHQNIGYIIINFLEKNGVSKPLAIVVPLVLTILIAFILTSYIEKPLQKYFKNKKNRRLSVNTPVRNVTN